MRNEDIDEENAEGVGVDWETRRRSTQGDPCLAEYGRQRYVGQGVGRVVTWVWGESVPGTLFPYNPRRSGLQEPDRKNPGSV